MRHRKGTRVAVKSGRILFGVVLAAMLAVLWCRSAAAQAIDPVDISGARRAAPTAVIPQARPQMAGAGATLAQAVVPVDVGSQPATAPATAPASNPAAQLGPMQPVAPGATAPQVPPGVVAWPTNAAATQGDNPSYPLTGIKIDYHEKHPQHPPIEELMNTEVRLGVVSDGYVAPDMLEMVDGHQERVARPGISTVTIRLGEIGRSGPQRIYRSGIASIYGQIVRFFNARGIIGVFVVVDPKDIGEGDVDIRGNRTTLQFWVYTTVVKELRTVAIGENVREGDRVDSSLHASITEHSPLQPALPEGGPRMDMLNKNVLDDYVLRLNRLPGRRVDVAVSGVPPTDAANQPYGVVLDYLVSESRPWYVYAQASNTGTSQTSVWRERFGFVDNQLTGHDDILNLDYLTADFSTSHAIIGSYELPFFDFDRVRYGITGSWNEFTASDVGLGNDQHLTGDQWMVGNELTMNIYQQRELFVDVAGGVRYMAVSSQNQSTGINGKADYVVPYLSLKVDRATDIASTSGAVTLLYYWTDASTDPSQEGVVGLGRTNPTKDPLVLQFSAVQTFFLEPLLDPNFATGTSTLAHEIALSAHGQYAFNYRLFPQAEDVAGGLYSVRGYPESIVAGDSVLIGSAEYRFHVPRALAPQNDPTKTPFLWNKSFRFAPQQPYGRPDWDLILKTFVDVGQVNINNAQTFEHNSTLVGAGVGVELQYKQNFNIRVDWGAALTNVRNDPTVVESGSNRFHVSTTILY